MDCSLSSVRLLYGDYFMDTTVSGQPPKAKPDFDGKADHMHRMKRSIFLGAH